MINKVKKEKVKKETIEESSKDKFNNALNMLVAFKSKTRLTDKDKTRFTCEMTEEVFDALSAFIRKHTKRGQSGAV